MRRKRTLWDKFWKDDKGRQGIVQRPNTLLISWAICAIIAVLLPAGSLENIIQLLGFLCLVAWSSLEAIGGISYFRRSLGILVLFCSIYLRIN